MWEYITEVLGINVETRWRPYFEISKNGVIVARLRSGESEPEWELTAAWATHFASTGPATWGDAQNARSVPRG